MREGHVDGKRGHTVRERDEPIKDGVKRRSLPSGWRVRDPLDISGRVYNGQQLGREDWFLEDVRAFEGVSSGVLQASRSRVFPGRRDAQFDDRTLCCGVMTSPTEATIRTDLAACYRMIAYHGWDDLVFTHISARVPGDQEHFLINPYGMLFEEITASSLVKVDLAGEKVEPSPYPVNPAGFVIHSAIHEARRDVACVLHIHTPEGVAVSAQEEGLLAISQQASLALASMGYHDYEGIALLDDEKPRLVADLGEKIHLILRNHGLLTVGATVAEAYLAMYNLQQACEVQIKAQAGGGALRPIAPEILAGVEANVEVVLAGLGARLV